MMMLYCRFEYGFDRPLMPLFMQRGRYATIEGEKKSMSSNFHVKAHAKWILSGEHAVLRGCPALVFPIPSKMVELFYTYNDEPLEVDFNAPWGETFMVLFW